MLLSVTLRVREHSSHDTYIITIILLPKFIQMLTSIYYCNTKYGYILNS